MPIRLLQPGDLPSILAIQRACYRSELLESGTTFRLKLRNVPEGCLGLDRQGSLGGYVFCQPWRAGEPMPLDDAGEDLPEDPGCLYIHDLAVLPAWRGTQGATDLLEGVFGLAAAWGLNELGLVAVQASEPFWARWGFRAVRTFDYAPGVPATYMVRNGVPGKATGWRAAAP